MNVGSGKSSFLSLLSFLGLPLQLPRRGNHKKKENVSFSSSALVNRKPIRPRAFAFQSRVTNPQRRGHPPGPGPPAGTKRAAWLGTGAPLRSPPSPRHPYALSEPPGSAADVCAAHDPAPQSWAFPSSPRGRPVPPPPPPGGCPGLPPSPAAGSPGAERGAGSWDSTVPAGMPAAPGRAVSPRRHRPAARPPAPALQGE